VSAGYEEDMVDEAAVLRARDTAIVFLTLSDDIATLSEEIERMKIQQRDYALNLLPEAMRDAGLIEIEVNGRAIEIQQEAHGNITEENKPLAMSWLQQNGYGALLNFTYTFKLGSKAESLLKRFQSLLGLAFPTDAVQVIAPYSTESFRAKIEEMAAELFPGKTTECKFSVHGGSLSKMIKERGKAGKLIPDFIGTYVPSVARIKKASIAVDESGSDPTKTADSLLPSGEV